MKLHSWISVGSIAALAMAMVTASAQETPPPDKETQKTTEEPEEKVIPVKWNHLTVGYTSFQDRSGLHQYARPADGLTLHELSLFTTGGENWPYARFTMRGNYGEDSYLNGYAALNHGHTVIRATREHYGFFVNDWRPKQRSDDAVTVVTVDHAITPKIGGFLQYRSSQREGQYPSPRDPNRTRSRTYGAGIQGDVLGGNAGLSYSERLTNDDTGAQPNTLQRTIDAQYSHDFSDSFSLEGSAGYTNIEQAGLRSKSVRSYALSGMFELGPMTGVQFHLGRQDYDLSNVLNAHVQKRFVSSARLIQRWPGWSLQFGVKHQETERIRADQSFVDVPKVNFYDARLAGRIGPARVTLRGSWEDLQATAIMDTFDPRQLLWDDKAMFQAKVDCGGELFSAYGTYTYKFQQNKQRGVQIDWSNFALGGSYVFNDAWNAFAEFSANNYRVQGGTETGQNLGFYFPNSRSIAVGLNWAQGANMSASASLNYYDSADVRGTQLTFSLRRHLAPDHDLELVFAPWRHEDRLYNISDYRTTFLSARYTVKF
ncbi:MAG: hypothetical protein WBD02_04560 [Acidimicrobiia bacterium]